MWAGDVTGGGDSPCSDHLPTLRCNVFSCICLVLQVYKVLFPYSPQKDDELELLDGDYVYVSTSDQGQTGT